MGDLAAKALRDAIRRRNIEERTVQVATRHPQMFDRSTMSDREVWKKASIIAAAFGEDEPQHSAERLFEFLRDATNPQVWVCVAAPVDVIAGVSKQ